MGKKYVAMFEKREKRGLTTTFYGKRIGKKVFDSREEAMTHAAIAFKRLSYVDRRKILQFRCREATEEEIREAEE